MNTRIPCNFSEIFPYQREISYFSKGKIEHKNKISGLGKDCDHALTICSSCFICLCLIAGLYDFSPVHSMGRG